MITAILYGLYEDKWEAPLTLYLIGEHLGLTLGFSFSVLDCFLTKMSLNIGVALIATAACFVAETSFQKRLSTAS